MTISPLSEEFKIPLMKLLSRWEKNISLIDSDEGVQIVLSKDFSIELDSTAVTVFFFGFENAFYSFDYNSYESYVISVCEFIENLMTHRIRIVTQYRNKVLYRKSVYILGQDSWKKIATIKQISICNFFGKSDITTKEFYYH